MTLSTIPLKYTVPFTIAANDGLLGAAAAERKEPTEIIQRATINYLIEKGYIDADEAERFKLFWKLVDQTVLAAQTICREGGFSRSITLDAIHLCMKDENWLDGYRRYVKDDIFKNGNPEKGPINREIGFRIRAGIGGVVEKGDNNKSATVKVLGEIIQSYTPMADYDRKAFGPKAAA
ncbi:hypothetical protein PY365_20690 [Roseiarcaceae bacterium H3SJ34-1]|uniref:hypothetical protein n=1 Tax=Terripilifer ovatus TaxID=3032367 RepID=UPI003AB958B0|nr:hypothetical protein [Roseiarcaceae bacterium H3SJ34-1]